MMIIYKNRDKVYIDTHVRQNMITFNFKLKTENDEPNHILHFHTHFIPRCRNFTLSAAAFQLPAAHINNNNNPVRTEFSPFICRVGVTSRCSSGVSTSPRSHAAVHAPLQSFYLVKSLFQVRLKGSNSIELFSSTAARKQPSYFLHRLGNITDHLCKDNSKRKDKLKKYLQ